MDLQNDKIEKALISVEALQKEYEITLTQYQEAVKNYINGLQTNNTTNTFAALPGRSWWGQNGLKEGTVDTQEECENMCATSENCSGATFNPSKRYCWTRSGEGVLSPGIDTNYALIPKQKSDLIIMQGLNDKLISLNEQITNELTTINPQVKQQDINKNMKQQELSVTYNKLLEQKLEMERQLEEYSSVEEDSMEQGLYASQENLSYRFWILLTILVIIITLRKMLGKSTAMSAIIWVCIMCVLVIFTFTLSYPAGFAIWMLVLMSIILMKTGFLPSP